MTTPKLDTTTDWRGDYVGKVVQISSPNPCAAITISATVVYCIRPHDNDRGSWIITSEQTKSALIALSLVDKKTGARTLVAVETSNSAHVTITATKTHSSYDSTSSSSDGSCHDRTVTKASAILTQALHPHHSRPPFVAYVKLKRM